MKKKILISMIVIGCFFSMNTVYAQKNHTKKSFSTDYKTAIGVKLGWFEGVAISGKHFVTNNNSVEGLLSFWRRGFRITGLYEFNWDVNTDGLKIYAGPGVHIGMFNSQNGGKSYLGIDGVLGLDYKFRNALINLSFDFQPSFELGYNDSFYG